MVIKNLILGQIPTVGGVIVTSVNCRQRTEMAELRWDASFCLCKVQ